VKTAAPAPKRSSVLSMFRKAKQDEATRPLPRPQGAPVVKSVPVVERPTVVKAGAKAGSRSAAKAGSPVPIRTDASRAEDLEYLQSRQAEWDRLAPNEPVVKVSASHPDTKESVAPATASGGNWNEMLQAV